MLGRWTLALALAALTFSSTAAAQDDRARMHFQAGASYYEAGEYEDALREFQRAYDLSQKPELFYNFSLSHQNLGNHAQAADYLARYLEQVQDVPNRTNLELRLQNLRERAAARDASETTTAPPVDRPPVETQPDAEPQETAGTDPLLGTGGGDGEAPAPGGPALPPPAPDADDGGGLPTLSLVSFIGAGVGVAAMATFGILALGEASAVEEGCYASSNCRPDDITTLDTFALVSDLGLAVAVVGAALGVTFLLTDGGGGAEERATVALSPWMGAGSAGASIQGGF